MTTTELFEIALLTLTFGVGAIAAGRFPFRVRVAGRVFSLVGIGALLVGGACAVLYLGRVLG